MFLRCPDILDKYFGVLRSGIVFYRINFQCAEIVKNKSTGNDSDFSTYSNTIIFASKWLENSGYMITQW